MKFIACHLFIGGAIKWDNLGVMGGAHPEDGITISFPIFHRATAKEACKIIAEVLAENSVEWLQFDRGAWMFRSDKFKDFFSGYETDSWLSGDFELEMDHDIRRARVSNREEDRTYVKFVITPEIVREKMERKIFLSHKGVDKPVIRRFKGTLEVLGFEPWLDEEAMVAGAELERALLAGFKSSCAAVFFVTPNYVDSGYLASEVNYAIQEKRRKGDRFSIVTLVLTDGEGKVGAVPELLNSYVWKSPATELEALIEIVKALPLQLGPTVWKK
jgi:hypothetical protein